MALILGSITVDIEGKRKLTNYDIFANAGGAMQAVQTIISVMVNDGKLNIDFLSETADLPRISGTEVISKSVTLMPSADNYKQYANYINSFFGELPYLNVKSAPANPELNRRAFIKFSLDRVVPVSSAKLRFYGRNYENNKQIMVSVLNATWNDWSESSLLFNYNLEPQTDVLSSVQVHQISQYYELDVTSFVKVQQKEGRDEVTFMLADLHERNTRLVFNSRQNLSNPPQLIVQSAPFQNLAARISLENDATEKITKEAASIVSPKI